MCQMVGGIAQQARHAIGRLRRPYSRHRPFYRTHDALGKLVDGAVRRTRAPIWPLTMPSRRPRRLDRKIWMREVCRRPGDQAEWEMAEGCHASAAWLLLAPSTHARLTYGMYLVGHTDTVVPYRTLPCLAVPSPYLRYLTLPYLTLPYRPHLTPRKVGHAKVGAPIMPIV